MATNSLSYSDVITQPSGVGQPKLDLSVVIPTRNEAGNIELLLARIRNAFSGDSFADSAVEVIFVDDSTDETPQVVQALVQVLHTLPYASAVLVRSSEAGGSQRGTISAGNTSICG